MKKKVLTIVALCCVLGCSEDSKSDTCTVGEIKCSSDGYNLYVCNDSGEWKATQCQDNEICKENACVKNETHACDKTAESCEADGKTLDDDKCECVAKKTCDKTAESCEADGKTLDDDKCECVANVNCEVCEEDSGSSDGISCLCKDTKCTDCIEGCRACGGVYESTQSSGERVSCRIFKSSANLQAKDAGLYDGNGKQIVLRGIVTPNVDTAQFLAATSPAVLQLLKEKFNVNMIRFTLPPKKSGESYEQKKVSQYYERIERALDNASKLGICSIVDWGVMNINEGNPLKTLDLDAEEKLSLSANAFFETVSTYSTNNPYVLFEIANEPCVPIDETKPKVCKNVDTWNAVKEYADKIIPIIRNHVPHAIIIVAGKAGAILKEPMNDPIKDDNIAYTYHNYPLNYRFCKCDSELCYGDILMDAVEKHRLTIISTEMSPMDAAQNKKNSDSIDYTSENWVKYMKLYCKHNISFAWFKFAFSWEKTNGSPSAYNEWELLKPINYSYYSDNCTSNDPACADYSSYVGGISGLSEIEKSNIQDGIMHMMNLDKESDLYKDYKCSSPDSKCEDSSPDSKCEDHSFNEQAIGSLTESGYSFFYDIMSNPDYCSKLLTSTSEQ